MTRSPCAELGHGSVISGPRDLDDAAHEVDRKIAGVKDRPLPVDLKLVTQGCAHAREKLLGAERLCDIIVRTQIERLHLADLVPPAGQHHNWHVFGSCSDHPQQFESADVGEPKVENNQIGFLRHQL